MKIILRTPYNEKKIFICMDEIKEDERFIRVIGRWEGSNPEVLENVERIFIPYENILHIEDDGFVYKDKSPSDENSGKTSNSQRFLEQMERKSDRRSRMPGAADPEGMRRMVEEKRREVEENIKKRVKDGKPGYFPEKMEMNVGPKGIIGSKEQADFNFKNTISEAKIKIEEMAKEIKKR